MNSDEASLFVKVCSLVLISGDALFLYHNNDLLMPYGVCYHDIIILEECGLMSSQQRILKAYFEDTPKDLFYNSNIIGFYTKKEEAKIDKDYFEIPIYLLTESGKQLYKIANATANEAYAIECIEDVKSAHKDCVISAHKIERFCSDGSVDYETIDILSKADDAS